MRASRIQLKETRGAAAILTIVIIGAATLLMSFTISRLSIGELDLGYTEQKGGEAYSLAEGCVEEVLRRIRLDTGYQAGSGDFVLSLDNGSCTMSVESSGSARTLRATSTVGEYHKELQVGITLSGTDITVSSWQEWED